MDSLQTPLDVDVYLRLLRETNYDEKEYSFLSEGFTKGFDIGYTGPVNRRSESKNLPFKPGIGNEIEMWNKIMKEVKLKRVAGPFEEVPFENYIQSPIGLVPKAGNKTRLIFHLSYGFNDQEPSINACTPREICKVKYNDLDCAVQQCLRIGKFAEKFGGNKIVYLGKTDLTSAFRILCMNSQSIKWLVFKARDPADGKFKFFVDKCLPFGASISCAHYQRFSNSLKHILKHQIGKLHNIGPEQARDLTNYLDDFLFLAWRKWVCNLMIQQFLELCKKINLPVALEKTEVASTLMVFLGILLDGQRMLLSLPIEKQQKALNLLNDLTGKRKITVKQLQTLTGYLNFLTRAIFPGRTFTRRIYSKYTDRNRKLRQHHHVAIDSEFRFDCEMWRFFLLNFRNESVCHPMVDLSEVVYAEQLQFTSDASAKSSLGMGATFSGHWLFVKWEENYIVLHDPSIEYLELLGVSAAILTWGHLLQNKRIVIYCDNQAVVAMVNKMSSSCKNCMYLLRLITLNNLVYNHRVFAKYISTKENDLSDALSRLQFDRFWRLAGQKGIHMDEHPSRISSLIWPASKIWQK